MGESVIRQWAPEMVAQSLGADMYSEVLAQRAAAVCGLAPSVQYFDATQRILIMPYIMGTPLEENWFELPQRCLAMQQILAKLKEVPLPHELTAMNPSVRITQLMGEVALHYPERSLEFASVVQEAQEKWQPFSNLSLPLCLVHSDLNPKNILVRMDGSLQLLDWEYAHAGDPLEDTAALLAMTPGLQPADINCFPCERLSALLQLRKVLDLLWYALSPSWHRVENG